MEKKRILIVDDEPEFVSMVKMRLENADYRVITAADGKEGLEKARSEKPDLILLDILMPHKDGYVFVKEAKQDEKLKDVPVIILTAKPAMQDKFKMENVSDYIMKPFEAQDLLKSIERLLAK